MQLSRLFSCCDGRTRGRSSWLLPSPARRLRRPAWPLTFCAALAFTFVGAAIAEAQIWVIVEADGTRRYTTEFRPGAELFMQTYSTPKPGLRPSGDVPFRTEISTAATNTGLDPLLVEAVIAAESAFNPRAVSHKGAQGLMQLMPATARRFRVANVWDPGENIRGGTAYLSELLDMFGGNVRHALAAYNSGENTVREYGGIPPYPETRTFVNRVLGYYRERSGSSF